MKVLLRNAMDLLDEGVLILNKDFKVTYVNPAYVRMFELEEERVIGEHIHDIYPNLPQSKRVVSHTFEKEKDITVESMEFHWRGKEMILQFQTKRFIHEGEWYVLSRIVDITEQFQREKHLIHMIEEMTANVVTIAKGYALLPLQPILREDQRLILLERVPVQCQEQNVTRLVIQFSGISEIDQEWAVLLRNLMHSLKLLGIEVVLAGMRPKVVRQFTENKIMLNDVRTFMNIRQATKYFLETGLKANF